jgi:predicted permease
MTPGYFATMGVRVLRGRDFSEDDRGGSQPVAIVSESMARHFWPGADAVGKRIGYPFVSPWITVVGVVPNMKVDSLRDTSTMVAYIPFLQRRMDNESAAELTLIAYTFGDPNLVGRQLRALVASIDPHVPVSEIRTMDDVVSASVAGPRFTTLLVGEVAIVALLLGAVGIYGVTSYVVSQRTQELGVRAALGATASDILRMVVGRAARLAIAGAAIGMGAALVAVHPLRALLYGVSTSDPLTYLTVPLVFVLIAVVASLGPARRATRVSPTSVLRAD